MNLTKKTLQTYWQHAWRYPWRVLGIIFLMPLVLLTHQLIPPIIAASVFDRLSSGDFVKNDLWGSFGTELIWYGGLVLVGGTIMWRALIYLVWSLEARVLRDLAQTQFRHLMELDSKFHSNSFSGSLVSQTNKFNSSYVKVADTTIFNVYTLVIAFVTATIVLWPRSPQYVIGLWVVSAIFILAAIKITRTVRLRGAEEAEAENKQTGVLADAVTNIMAVKSFAASSSENERFAKATNETAYRTNRLMWTSLKSEMVFGAFTSVIDGLALIVGAMAVVVLDSQAGTVFLVMAYTNSITFRLWDFSQSALKNYNRAIGDAEEGAKRLLRESEVRDPAQPEDVRIENGTISFAGVDFSHKESADDPGLFKNLNIEIPAGQKVGLVGHSGSGKTTLTKLLLRFKDIDEGSISIDGQDIRSITQDDLRQNIAYVPQEPLLFHRSIAENISYGAEEIDEKAMIVAAQQANAHDFVRSLADGYETLVGERGVKLSGGQKQRVAIARALVKNAPILVLDEATSALDSESEKLIQDALWNLMEGRTTLVIAHRLSTIQKLDRILVMEDGKVIEDGSHTELVAKKGVYAELWSHQSGGFIED